MDDLLQLAAQQETPTIAIEGQLSNLSVTEDALQLPQDNEEASERLALLRRSLPNQLRVVEVEGPFRHGQSISLTGSESRGSAGVFLSADNGDGVYALTAGHTVSDLPEETRIVTPGLLDVLGKLAQIYPSYPNPDQMQRSGQKCGQVETKFIGVNKDGWRDDWGLVRLFGPWKTSNGNWFNIQQVEDMCRCNKTLFPQGFTGSG